MFVHTSGFRKTLTIPTYILDDERVSIGAKGLFIQLFYSNDNICALNDLCKVTSSTEEELKKYFNELAETGYIMVSDKRCDLRHKAASEKMVAKKTDITEVGLDDVTDWDFVVNNNSDLENLNKKADEIIDLLKDKL